MILPPPHPATLSDEQLLKQCDISFGRVGGPGGQHRNRVDTAATVRHRPTSIVARATERRSQGQNRSVALRRLRVKLAVQVRCPIPRRIDPSPLWRSRRQGRTLSVNPKHGDYPALLAEALDVIAARRFDVAGAAGALGVSMSQLAKLVRHEKHAFAAINAGRSGCGLPALK